MAVKRFYAADMHSALNNIRNNLGADAVILATRQLADGVEVSAAAGIPDAELNSAKSTYSDSKSPLAGVDAGQNWMLNSIGGMEQEQSALQSELGSISSLLQNWMDTQGWDNYATKSPKHAKLWERFRSMGVQPELIRSLLAEIASDLDIKSTWQACLTSLSQKLPVSEEDPIRAGGIFALVGATGVGKTTTLGKLATRYVLEYGPEDVALVTTDRYRIAAQEQLKVLGKILGVSVHAVDEDSSLTNLLYNLRAKRLVLIDTAGIGASHRNFEQHLSMLSGSQAPIKPLLVLSATSQSQVQAAELQAYSHLGLAGAIITKTDEAASLGESISLLISKGLPLAYKTNGQSIPEDIKVANRNEVIFDAVEIARENFINKDQMIAGFSAVIANTDSRETHALSVN